MATRRPSSIRTTLGRLFFAGRLTEDFKLLNGIFVHTEKLRAGVLEALSPLVSEAVITGRPSYIGLLVWLNSLPAGASRDAPDATPDDVRRSGRVRSARATHYGNSMHVWFDEHACQGRALDVDPRLPSIGGRSRRRAT